MSGRLILVSNRLPVTVSRRDGGGWDLRPSSGGLATGLSGLHGGGETIWVGWPGALPAATEAERASVRAALTEMRAVPVELDEAVAERHYEGFSNGVLWPLFHYLLDRVSIDARRDFEAHVEASRAFADTVAGLARDDDTIWVHDYQLMLLPAMLRERMPSARIGFFLHVPFPSSEVFRALPWARQILEGVLGADLIGFHAFPYQRHFTSSVLRILGLSTDIDHLEVRGRPVRLGVFPMGIDAGRWSALAADPAVIAEAEEIRREEAGRAILLGVDRLDYTKGLLGRVLAVDSLLERRPCLKGRVRLIQVAVPSRSGIDEYDRARRELEEAIGRVGGRHATVDWTPIRYLHSSVSERHLAALYLASDVMLVTPLRDGMNLVAKEFVACRHDEDGVLVLSQLAGAAEELGAALSVNPYDIGATVDAIETALAMPREARRAAMASLRERVLTHDVRAWGEAFLQRLASTPAVRRAAGAEPAPATAAGLAARIASSAAATLLLDYDGTLVPIAATPCEAAPDPALLDLLRTLASQERLDVHVVSGRPTRVLEQWLGGCGVTLHAEHGAFVRVPGRAWEGVLKGEPAWKPRVRGILREFTARTPGAFVEEKLASVAWHYRGAEPAFGSLQARELRLHLLEVLSNSPAEVLPGRRVVEVRGQGVHKGLAVRRAMAMSRGSEPLVVAVGDDVTDEDMFAAVPDSGLSVRVGPGRTSAVLRLPDVAAVRELLEALVVVASRP